MHFSCEVDRLAHHRIVRCEMHHTVLDAARAMVAAESSSVLIQDQGEVVGIWTESDALDLQHTYAISHTVLADVMTSPVHTIAENARLDALDRQFRARNTRHSLVVSAGTVPQAVVSEAELVFAVGLEARFARRSLEGYMLEELPVVAAESSIAEAERLMKLSAKEAVVLNDGRLCSMADVVRALAEDDLDRRVGDLPLEPVIGIASTARLGDALRQLRRHGSRYVAVLDDSRKVRGYLGIQRIHQIIESAYLAQLKTRVEGTDRQLRLSSQHLQLAEAVIDASLNSIMIVGANGRIASVNPAFSKVTGYAPEEVVGRTPAVLDSGRHDRAFFEEMRHRLEAEGSWQGEVWNRRKSGETYPEWLSISVIPNDDGGVGQYACIFNDISHQKDIEKENLRLAFSDPLTGLPNRKTFTERLSRAVRAAERDRHKVAALVIDLDLFGRVNDTLGHEVGDDVLTQFAARMAEAVGNDEALARLGADEFAVLLPKLEALEDSVPAVTALDALSKQPFMIDSKEVYLTTSTGISFFPDDGDSAETLLRNATTAMHQSKSNGRNHSRYYTRAMNAQSSDRLDMQSNLRASLDRGELALVYQPKVALLGDRVVSQEALLRWRNRDLGMVPPKVFVPLAEELGIIEEISRWVIREACRQNLVWMHQGLPARRMSVNISAIHMRRGTLVDDVTDILAELDYAPENLDLEVTESAFIENVDEASAMLRQLRDLGITIAIDDFGTGYSSLSYLKKIPADLMKIDSSFVADLESNKDDRQIIQAIIAMGHNLGLEVVAEGVETLAQLSFLRDSGCDQVQGYVFGRPLPPEEYYDVYSEARVPMTAAGGCNCLRG